MNHVSVNLDGQQIAQSVQKSTLKYNIRNNGVPTAHEARAAGEPQC